MFRRSRRRRRRCRCAAVHAEVALLGQTHYLESERGKERGQVVRVSSQLPSPPVAETEGWCGGRGAPLCVTSLAEQHVGPICPAVDSEMSRC